MDYVQTVQRAKSFWKPSQPVPQVAPVSSQRLCDVSLQLRRIAAQNLLNASIMLPIIGATFTGTVVPIYLESALVLEFNSASQPRETK